MVAFAFGLIPRYILLYIIFSLSQNIFPDSRPLEPLTMSYESGAGSSGKWLDLFYGNKIKQKMIGSLSKLLLAK